MSNITQPNTPQPSTPEPSTPHGNAGTQPESFQPESKVEATKEVARTAQEQAGAVATEARQQASEVAADAKHQAQNVVHDAKEQLRQQADAQTAKVAESLHRLTGELQALCEGRPQEAGTVAQYAREAGTKLDDFASKVGDRGFEGLVDDLQRFARRRPAAFLAAAAAAGFFAGRMFRSVKDEAAEDGDGDAVRSQFGEAGMLTSGSYVDLTAPMPSQPAFPAEQLG
jgi:hypothetical protein